MMVTLVTDNIFLNSMTLVIICKNVFEEMTYYISILI